MKLATRTFNKERGTGANQYYITSPFGWRKDPKTGVKKFHSGCDYGTHGNHWALYALENGTVESSYKDNYGALCVVVAYPRLGIRLTYVHMSQVCVNKGDSVTHDTIIGYAGMSGYATGIHLHLGVRRIGGTDYIDPEGIDYEEGPSPEPTPGEFPWEGVVIKGSALYNEDGVKYPNGALYDRTVTVEAEINGRYKVYGKTFNPHIVYVDKENVSRKTNYPFEGIVKKGSILYNKEGRAYKYPAQYNRTVTVNGEYKDMYEVWSKAFNPNTVYCKKGDLMKKENKTSTEFKVGDKVNPINLVDYVGTKLTVYDSCYYITALGKDTATLSALRDGKYYVWAILKLDNIRKEK